MVKVTDLHQAKISPFHIFAKVMFVFTFEVSTMFIIKIVIVIVIVIVRVVPLYSFMGEYKRFGVYSPLFRVEVYRSKFKSLCN
jgi:hypothetical protein